MNKMIFVFGSNLGGRHDAGAARYAYEHKGAKWLVGQGRMGDSYALPTKDIFLKTLPLIIIRGYVLDFLDYATTHELDLTFQVTRVGCGLAGCKDSDIAPMFKDAPSNCYFDEAWKLYLPKHKFWGTYGQSIQTSFSGNQAQ